MGLGVYKGYPLYRLPGPSNRYSQWLLENDLGGRDTSYCHDNTAIRKRCRVELSLLANCGRDRRIWVVELYPRGSKWIRRSPWKQRHVSMSDRKLWIKPALFENLNFSCQDRKCGCLLLSNILFSPISDERPETRRIVQIQWLTWPHKGIPDDPTSLLQLLAKVGLRDQSHWLFSDEFVGKQVEKHGPVKKKTIVVHGSGGVGRTGCFIAAHIEKERFVNEQQLSLYESKL